MKRKHSGKIFYMEPAIASASLVAGFTTRHEGVSRAPYNSLNLGKSTNDSIHNVKGNRSLLARAFGTTLDQVVTVTQVHGNDILVIDQKNDDFSHFDSIECDGIITNQKGVMIGVCVADCVPVLLHDPVKNVIASLHAGWKGTASAIVSIGVETMVSMFGCCTSDIKAALGPAIGECCYEVDEPVKAGFPKNSPLWGMFSESRADGKWNIDLKGMNRHLLLSAGLSEANIQNSDICVCCSTESFFSYRREGGDTGRQMGFIMIPENA